MAEILHYLGCINSFLNRSDTPPFTKCRIAYINSMGWDFSLSQRVGPTQLHWIKIGVTDFETRPSTTLVSLKFLLQRRFKMMDAYEDDAPKRTSRILDYMFPRRNPGKQLSFLLDVPKFDTSFQWEPQGGNASSWPVTLFPGLVQKNVTWRVWNLAPCYFEWGFSFRTCSASEMWRFGRSCFHGI